MTNHLAMLVTITLNAALAGKVLGIMAVVYAVLQALKKAFPAISGYWSLAINVLLSVVGAVVIIPPEQLFSLATLTTLLVGGITAAGAAGVHGTVQNLAPAGVQAVLGQAPLASKPMEVASK